MTRLNFATLPVVPSETEIRAAVVALGLPDRWTHADDVTLLTILGRGGSIADVANATDHREGNVKARWLALAAASRGGDPRPTLTAQERLLKVVRELARG